MYYANCEQLKSEVRELGTDAHPPLSWFCLDFGSVDDVDFSAAQALQDIYRLLRQRNIRLTYVEVEDSVRKELDLYGITQLIGPENIFGRIHELEAAFAAATTNLSTSEPSS
jgi:MFS superfamily sulfate permease-like transporter